MKYKPELHKLSNGVPVILDPMDMETAQFKIVFFTGSRDEKPNEYGITHFCEHMFCKASKRFPSDRARTEYLEDNGCSLNASTGMDCLMFHGKAIPRNLGVLIDCIGEQLQNPLFSMDEIEQERGPILGELRRREDDTIRTDFNFLYKNVFGGRDNHTLGTPENIKSFTRKQMLFFIRRRMSASNCVICISGKIQNREKLFAQLEKSFGFLRPFNVKENNTLVYTPKCAHKLAKSRNNVGVKVLFPRVWPMDLEHRFERLCVNHFLRILRDRLYKKLRQENGLVYGVSKTSFGEEDVVLDAFTTHTAPENVAKCVALIAQTCADMYYNNSFTGQDVTRLNNCMELGDMEYFDNPDVRARDLVDEYRDYGTVYNFPGIVKMGRSIKRADIIKNTRGIFDNKISIITIGPKFDGDLMQIWRDNFKPANENILSAAAQKKKTR